MAQVTASRPAGISRARINIIMLVSLLLSVLTVKQLVTIQVYKIGTGDRNLTERAQQELSMHVVLQPRRGTGDERVSR